MGSNNNLENRLNAMDEMATMAVILYQTGKAYFKGPSYVVDPRYGFLRVTGSRRGGVHRDSPYDYFRQRVKEFRPINSGNMYSLPGGFIHMTLNDSTVVGYYLADRDVTVGENNIAFNDHSLLQDDSIPNPITIGKATRGVVSQVTTTPIIEALNLKDCDAYLRYVQKLIDKGINKIYIARLNRAQEKIQF